MVFIILYMQNPPFIMATKLFTDASDTITKHDNTLGVAILYTHRRTTHPKQQV